MLHEQKHLGNMQKTYHSSFCLNLKGTVLAVVTPTTEIFTAETFIT